MYDMYYLNFISPIPRELLEMIASAAVEGNSVQQIAKVRIFGDFRQLFLDLDFILFRKNFVLKLFSHQLYPVFVL